MLEKLTIQNFQCHETLEIFLSPGTTSLIGKTDSGKTAVLRALRWLATNKPSGDAFLQQGAESVVVRLHFDGNRVIQRSKGKDGNAYFLDGKEFKAFGQDVPPEIAAALNIGDVAWALQHDGPFWLALSSGQVSKELNALVNLEAMDRSLADVNSRLRRSNAEIDVTEQRLATARQQRDSLVWVNELDAELQALERQEQELVAKTHRIAQIESSLQEAERIDSRLRTLSDANQEALRAIGIGERLQAVTERANKLQYFIDSFDKLDKDLKETLGRLQAAEAELQELTRDGCPVCGSVRNFQKM